MAIIRYFYAGKNQINSTLSTSETQMPWIWLSVRKQVEIEFWHIRQLVGFLILRFFFVMCQHNALSNFIDMLVVTQSIPSGPTVFISQDEGMKTSQNCLKCRRIIVKRGYHLMCFDKILIIWSRRLIFRLMRKTFLYKILKTF